MADFLGGDDALQYQHLKPLEEVQSMPAFLEKEQGLLKEEQRRKQQINAENIKFLTAPKPSIWSHLQSQAADMWNNDEKEISGMIASGANPATETTPAANAARVRYNQIMEKHTNFAETAKELSAFDTKSQALLGSYIAKGDYPPELVTKAKENLSGFYAASEKSAADGIAFMNEHKYDMIPAYNKPFEEAKAMGVLAKDMPFIEVLDADGKATGLEKPNPTAIAGRADVLVSDDKNREYYQKWFDEHPNEQKKWTDIASTTGKSIPFAVAFDKFNQAYGQHKVKETQLAFDKAADLSNYHNETIGLRAKSLDLAAGNLSERTRHDLATEGKSGNYNPNTNSYSSKSVDFTMDKDGGTAITPKAGVKPVKHDVYGVTYEVTVIGVNKDHTKMTIEYNTNTEAVKSSSIGNIAFPDKTTISKDHVVKEVDFDDTLLRRQYGTEWENYLNKKSAATVAIPPGIPGSKSVAEQMRDASKKK